MPVAFAATSLTIDREMELRYSPTPFSCSKRRTPDLLYESYVHIIRPSFNVTQAIYSRNPPPLLSLPIPQMLSRT